MCASIVTQVVNSSINHDGYAPAQWVLGQNSLRAPGTLLDPHEAEMLEVQEAATDPQSAMARSLQMREAAKISIIKQDNDGRLRRARLHKVVPMPPIYETGAYVYFKRKKDRSVAVKPGEDAPRHQQSKPNVSMVWHCQSRWSRKDVQRKARRS